MIKKFQHNLNEFLSEKSQPRILLAVSGGIDSMVMLDLFLKSGIEIGIAHCNFQLRGAESDADEEFIIETAKKNNVVYYINRFNTHDYAETNGISIQMAARDLRYEWFHELLKEFKYDMLALAHNLDDKIETFFINLLRGTGLKGITGMKMNKKDIIRPLLNIPRKEIEQYSTENQIIFREDSSNSSNKYLRNKIRHEIIPVFKDCEPSFLNVMESNMERFENAWIVYNDYIENRESEIVEHIHDVYKINIEQLKALKYKDAVTYEIFSAFNFTQSAVHDILNSLDHQSGLKFFSSTHRCIKDRNELIVSKNKNYLSKKYYIDKETLEINNPVKLQFEYIQNKIDFKIEKELTVAQVDFEKLTFPLILRKWQHGDFFQPFGMKGFKKISDFFIDNKFSLLQKDETWLLTSGEMIVWIIGHRLDDRFKVSPTTKNILVIRLLKNE